MAGPWDDYAPAPWDEYAAMPEISAGAEAKIPKRQDKTDYLQRFSAGYTDPFNAIAQVAAKGLTAAGLPPPFPVDQNIKDAERQYQEQRGENAGTLDGARMVGNIVNPINVAITSKIPMKAGFGAKVLGGATAGAGSGLLNPVYEGDFLAEKAKQAGVGAAVGGAVPVAISGVSRLISPKASVNPNLQLLKSEGVRPTIGQTLGGGWNKAEEQAMSVPILGNMIARARGAANNQLEVAAHNRALNPIGLSLPKGVAGRDAVEFTGSTISNRYNNVLDKIGAIPADDVFANNVANLKSMVDKLNITPEAKQAFAYSLDDVGSYLGGKNTFTSEGYKILEGSLRSDAQALGKSGDRAMNKLAPAVSQLRQELKDLLKRQAGGYADDLAATNRAWANFKRVQNASAKIGAEEGRFTPAQLQNAVQALDKSKDKGAFAKGSALMQDLSEAGKSVLGNKVPDSGTAGRGWLSAGLLGAGGVANPLVAGTSLIGGSALYTSPAQAFLRGVVSSRPAVFQPISQFLQNNGNALIPAANASIPYLLNKQSY